MEFCLVHFVTSPASLRSWNMVSGRNVYEASIQEEEGHVCEGRAGRAGSGNHNGVKIRDKPPAAAPHDARRSFEH